MSLAVLVLLTVLSLLGAHPPHLHVAAGVQRGQLVAVRRPRKACSRAASSSSAANGLTYASPARMEAAGVIPCITSRCMCGLHIFSAPLYICDTQPCSFTCMKSNTQARMVLYMHAHLRWLACGVAWQPRGSTSAACTAALCQSPARHRQAQQLEATIPLSTRLINGQQVEIDHVQGRWTKPVLSKQQPLRQAAAYLKPWCHCSILAQVPHKQSTPAPGSTAPRCCHSSFATV
jgi:hypothetical protein